MLLPYNARQFTQSCQSDIDNTANDSHAGNDDDEEEEEEEEGKAPPKQ